MAKKSLHIGEPTAPISAEHRAQSCTGKVRYRKRGGAISEARRIYKHGPDLGPLSVYPCAYCGGWHVGKATKLILSRVRVVQAA